MEKNKIKKYSKYISMTQRKLKNTTQFAPDYSDPNIRVMIGAPGWSRYPYQISDRDIVIVHGLCANVTSYEELVNNIPDHVWVGWHGNHENPDGTHWIANDRENWKNKSVKFNEVINKLSNYFQVEPKATRLNVYENLEEHKPFHKDRSAINQEAAKTQNVTIGCNIGCERVIRFVTDKGEQKIDFPLFHGSVYLFGNKVNEENKHGIPPLRKFLGLNEPKNKARASVVLWGWSCLLT